MSIRKRRKRVYSVQRVTGALEPPLGQELCRSVDVLFHVACYDGWEHQLHLLEHSAHCVANLTFAYLANEFKFFYETRSFIARFRLLFHMQLSAALLKTATDVNRAVLLFAATLSASISSICEGRRGGCSGACFAA